MSNGSPAAVRVRKSVWKLTGTNDDLFWYGKAVADMRKRLAKDPTSWRYQSGVHGFNPGSNPPGLPGGPLPSNSVISQFWNQCQHQSWFFLPWHRGYLAYFEQIVAAAVVKVGGPPNWALPYWNYSDGSNPNARKLHPAFIKQTLPDGSSNPLFSGSRKSNGNFVLKKPVVDLSCLTRSPFQGNAASGDPGFGGPTTAFNHHNGPNGWLESVPHNVVHDAIGGLMQDPDTAALDPIFWLHHANIDRLWDVWRHRNTTFVNPTASQWLTGVTFKLHDSSGTVKSFTASQMVDSKTVLHGYTYDDISDPIPASPHLSALATRSEAMARQPQQAQMVAASEQAVPLVGPLTTATVPFRPQATAAARSTLASAQRPARAYLNLENVTGEGTPGTYEVYVDIPREGQQPSLQNAVFAGLMSTFGVHAASRVEGPQAGSGITSVIDITDAVEKLRSEHHWQEDKLHVLFAKDEPEPASATLSVAPSVKVGRISVYYS